MSTLHARSTRPTYSTCADSSLHPTAAAILEAQGFAAQHAVMLVHSFSASDAWLADYQAFTQRRGAHGAEADLIVAVRQRGGIPLYLGWIRGEERYARA